MAGLSNVLLSVGTALGAPAAYFAILKYPELFAERVGAMAAYQESHLALDRDCNFIMKYANSAATAMAQAFAFSKDKEHQSIEERERIGVFLSTECAKLQGHCGANELTNNFIEIASKHLEVIADGWRDNSLKPNDIYMATIALDSGLQVLARQGLARNIFYNVQINAKQAAIESLNWMLKVAMYGLKAYLIMVALWAGYILREYGLCWPSASAIALSFFALAIFFLTRIANKSVKVPQKLLTSLKEQNARGQ